MCTAVWEPTNGLFGRTLDLEYTYDEQVVIAPGGLFGGWYGMIGVATVADGYPLYYDGVNEKGVAVAEAVHRQHLAEMTTMMMTNLQKPSLLLKHQKMQTAS